MLVAQGHKFQLIFDERNIIDHAYIAVIKKLNIRLVFSVNDQVLEYIEINKLDECNSSFINFYYNNSRISSLSLKNIYYNSFGPTYPGEILNGNYILSYPGISFRYPIPLFNRETHNDENETLSRLLNSENVPLSAIAIHTSNNWTNFIRDLSIYDSNLSSRTKEFAVDEVYVNAEAGSLNFNFKNHPKGIESYVVILKKSLQQDILSVLGPPDGTFWKKDSRLAIHEKRHLSNEDAGDANAVHEIFHNYYNLGFDLLYDLSDNQGARVKKVILHNNIPTSLMFQKYKKCNWKMIGFEGYREDDWSWTNKKKSHSGMYFSEISSKLKYDGLTKPIVLNRNETFRSLEDSVEVINHENGDGNDDGDDDEKAQADKEEELKNRWGQSLIYAYERCIWEVLSANGIIGSVTLY